MDFSDKDWEELYFQSNEIVFYCSIIAIIIGFIKKKYFSNPIRIFYLYLWIDLLIALIIQLFLWLCDNYPDQLLPILDNWEISDTNFFGILYNINVVGILGWYFSKVIPSARVSRVIKWISIALVASMIINYLFIEGFRVLGVFNPTVATICGFIFPFCHLWYLFRRDYQLVLTKNPYFWIALGFVFYMLLGFFQTITGGQIFEMDYILFTKFNLAKNSFMIIGYLFFCIGFLTVHNIEYLKEDQD